MIQFIRRLLGRGSKSTLPPFKFERNRFKTKKKWPPTVRNLTEKQQFTLERKWKRRLLLKSIKPQWNRWTKIVQWNLIGGFVIFSVFFYDFSQDSWNPAKGEQPFPELRMKMWRLWYGLWMNDPEEIEERSRKRVNHNPAPGSQRVSMKDMEWWPREIGTKKKDQNRETPS